MNLFVHFSQRRSPVYQLGNPLSSSRKAEDHSKTGNFGNRAFYNIREPLALVPDQSIEADAFVNLREVSSTAGQTTLVTEVLSTFVLRMCHLFGPAARGQTESDYTLLALNPACNDLLRLVELFDGHSCFVTTRNQKSVPSDVSCIYRIVKNTADGPN